MIPTKSSTGRNVENILARNPNVVNNVQGDNQVYRPPQINRFENQDAQRCTENQNRGNEYRNYRNTPEPAKNRQGRDFRKLESSSRNVNVNQNSGNFRRDVHVATKEKSSSRVVGSKEDERLVSSGELEVHGKKLPRIPVTINGKSVLAGASVNFVRTDVLQNIDLTSLPNPNIVQLGCQTSTSQSLGHVECKIKIETERFKIRATVLSMLNEPLVLGDYTMARKKCRQAEVTSVLNSETERKRVTKKPMRLMFSSTESG
ncbi:hypothetical protein JTB14_016488 [Gonioctena quinquepunctata]|nr:hypothetical protein JTB14_016488 [Gonioctena quinquepunctata]